MHFLPLSSFGTFSPVVVGEAHGNRDLATLSYFVERTHLLWSCGGCVCQGPVILDLWRDPLSCVKPAEETAERS